MSTAGGQVVIFPDKRTRALRRLRRRNARRRRQRLQAIQTEVQSRSQSRWGIPSSTFPSRVIDKAEREDGTRRPTRQELQIQERFYQSVRELGIA
jgi:hypothetical protein